VSEKVTGQEPTNEPTEPANVQDTEPTSQPPAAAQSVGDLPEWAKKVVKDLRTENAKHRKAKIEAEKVLAAKESEALAQQGKYKEMWEKADAQRIEAEQRATAAELARIKASISAKHNLPAALADRLRGDTEEELEADALVLLDAMPRSQPVTQTDGGAGLNGNTPAPGMSEQEVQEMAARYNVSVSALKQSLGIRN